MAIARVTASAVLLGALVGCSSGAASGTVIESVSVAERSCDDASEHGEQCLRVRAVVVGDGSGQGRCLLYASGRDRNLFIAADSGTLALRPGLDLVWDITVEIPAAQEFDGIGFGTDHTEDLGDRDLLQDMPDDLLARDPIGIRFE